MRQVARYGLSVRLSEPLDTMSGACLPNDRSDWNWRRLRTGDQLVIKAEERFEKSVQNTEILAMLVLTRKENQRVIFPNLGVAIKVLRISSNAVRVGIDAPKEIRVLRDEVPDEGADVNPGSSRHATRNRLNATILAVHIVQQQLEKGMIAEAETMLQRALAELETLDRMTAESPMPLFHEAVSGDHRRALLVDDDVNERELLAGLLQLSGYEVDVVDDGMAALSYLSEHGKPDCVLLDMQMPRMDGRTTIAAIRSNPEFKDLKVFAVTGMDRTAVDVSIGDRGVDRWFSKPLKPSEFMRDLDVELRSRRRTEGSLRINRL